MCPKNVLEALALLGDKPITDASVLDAARKTTATFDQITEALTTMKRQEKYHMFTNLYRTKDGRYTTRRTKTDVAAEILGNEHITRKFTQSGVKGSFLWGTQDTITGKITSVHKSRQPARESREPGERVVAMAICT